MTKILAAALVAMVAACSGAAANVDASGSCSSDAGPISAECLNAETGGALPDGAACACGTCHAGRCE